MGWEDVKRFEGTLMDNGILRFIVCDRVYYRTFVVGA